MRIFAPILVAPVALILVTSRAEPQGQLVASEAASVSQTVDGTKVTITYSRPRARGRTGLFGTQVKWGSTWTPGANVATRLDLSKDVTIQGQPVPKGSYSVWFVVDRAATRCTRAVPLTTGGGLTSLGWRVTVSAHVRAREFSPGRAGRAACAFP